MRSCASYIKNSTDLIKILRKTKFNPDCVLVTLDVSSLYTNISHEDALDTLSKTFDDDVPNVPYSPPLSVLQSLLHFVLQNNVFNFNDIFSQLHGVAVGTKLAPALAALFLSHIEEPYIRA